MPGDGLSTPWKWLFSAAALAGAACANAPAHLADEGPASAPPGLVKYCASKSNRCLGFASEASSVSGGRPPDFAALDFVNRSVNHAIRPTADGALDSWSLPLEPGGKAIGDCEDYALEKQRLLMAQGWPRSSLRLAVALHPRLGTHAVLIATTAEGDFVLDNLSQEVRLWNETGYVFLSRQSPHDDLLWTRVRWSRSGTAEKLPAWRG